MPLFLLPQMFGLGKDADDAAVVPPHLAHHHIIELLSQTHFLDTKLLAHFCLNVLKHVESLEPIPSDIEFVHFQYLSMHPHGPENLEMALK